MASSCTHKEASFVSLGNLDDISILLDEDNDLEEETTHIYIDIYNEKIIFILKFEKRTLGIRL